MRRGGDARSSSYVRRRRKAWLLRTFGNGMACPCSLCGRELDVETVEADRILPGALGGRYVRGNIRPACRGCNARQGGIRRDREAA